MAYVGKAPSTGRYSILDDISSSFTGSTAGPFNLTVNGTAIAPGNEANCIISVSGVIQEPQSAYIITGSQITYSIGYRAVNAGTLAVNRTVNDSDSNLHERGSSEIIAMEIKG